MSKVEHDSEVLAAGQQVITGCALIHKTVDGVPHVFLARRAKTKKFLPDVYEIPGGHIDFGESLEDGLIREIEEEFLVKVKLGMPFAAFTYKNDVKKSHSAEVVYFATFIDEESKITIEPEDHSGFIWVSLDNIEQAYTKNKGEDDEEIKIIRTGLKLLNGEGIDFGV